MLNGQVLGNAVPQKGLRQHDPSSPYLFLIFAEGLSSLLQHEQATYNLEVFLLLTVLPKTLIYFIYLFLMIVYCLVKPLHCLPIMSNVFLISTVELLANKSTLLNHHFLSRQIQRHACIQAIFQRTWGVTLCE